MNTKSSKKFFLLALLTVLFAPLLFLAFPSKSATISDFSVTPADTTAGATTTYSLSFTAPSDIPSPGGFVSLSFIGSGMPEEGYAVDVSSATLGAGSTITGNIQRGDDQPITGTGIELTGAISAGSAVTINLSSVINPFQAGGYWAEVRTNVMGTDIDEGVSSLFYIGDVVLIGRVVDPDGNPLPWTGVEAHTEDYSTTANGSTNDYGQFALAGLGTGSYLFDIHLSPDSSYIAPDPLTVSVTSGSINDLGDISVVSPTKFVSGKVLYKDGSPVSTAQVSANLKGGRNWSGTDTGSDGSYSLGLTGGTWELHINPQWDQENNCQMNVDWAYMGGPPVTVTFKDDTSSESETGVNFTVVRATARVTGKVVFPDGTALTSGGVDVRNNEGQGAGGGVSGDGTFSLSVPAGTYSFNVFSDDPTYAAPAMNPFTIGDNETKNLGTITLVLKNERIRGKVYDKNGVGLSGIRMNCWSPTAGGWAEATTGSDGTYELLVSPGSWEVMPQPDPATCDYVYEAGPPTTISISKDQTVTGVDFRLVHTDAVISGRVVDSSGSVISGFFGFAQAMAGTGDMSTPGPGTEVQNGIFTLKVPHGTWTVNVDTPPGSDYTCAGGQAATVGTGETKSVSVVMLRNNASIVGTVKDQNNDIIRGTRVEVFAQSSNGSFKHAFVNPDTGMYSLGVLGGISWYVGVHAEPTSGYMMVPPDDNKLTPAAGETLTKDFNLLITDSEVIGRVFDPNGNGLSNVFVFADSNAGKEGGAGEFKGPGLHTGTLTGSTGEFKLMVPAGTFGIGSGAPSSLGYINPPIQRVTVSPTSPATNVILKYRASDGRVTGSITLDGSKHAAFVWAWSESGGFSETMSFSGDYQLNVTKNETWHIGADFQTGGNIYRSSEHIVYVGSSGTATQDLILAKAPYTMPPAVSRTFNAANPATILLENGMTISIPAGALATSGTVTVTVTPTAELAKQQNSRPLAFGYNITALNSSGQPITSTFNSDVTITIPYTDAMLAELGITEDDLNPAYWDDDSSLWQGVTSFSVNKDDNEIVITVNHFTSFALVTGAADTTSPSAPADVTVTDPQTGGVLNLSWTNSTATDLDHVNIYRSESSGTLGSLIHSTTASSETSYSNTGLTNGTTYYYTLRSVDTTGNESINTTQYSGTPTSGLPATGRDPKEALWEIFGKLILGLSFFGGLISPRVLLLRKIPSKP